MPQQHSDDYKLIAVKYYLEIENYVQTCKIFKCSRRSLRRWVKRYINTGLVSNKNRKEGSYKIKQKHVDYLKKIIKTYPDLYLWQIHKMLSDKFNDYEISWQHLHDVIRDNNITRKKTSHKHFPKITYGKLRNEQKELKVFFKKINDHDLDDIICIDETSMKGGLTINYSRSELGKRSVVKTSDNKIYRKFTLVSAITTKGCIGCKLYEKGGMDSERFVEFLDSILKNKKDKLVVFDNGGMHKTKDVRNKIIKSSNDYLYIVTYHSHLNAIEEYFNQLKHYVKLDKPLTFDKMKTSIRNAHKHIKKNNYRNYFLHAYDIKKLLKVRKESNRKRKIKKYKIGGHLKSEAL